MTILSDYKITFGAKDNFFDSGIVGNPYSRLLYGTNRTDLIICYQDSDSTNRAGLCEIGLIDVSRQNITFGKQIEYDSPACDNYETQLADKNGITSNILVGYTSATDSSLGPGKLVVGKYDISLDSISFGSPVTFNVGNNDQSNVVELERDDSYFVVCYSVGARDNQGTGCRIGQYDVNGLTAKFGSILFQIPSSGQTDGMAVSRALNNGTFLVCYATDRQGVSGIGECVIGTIPGLDKQGLECNITYTRPVVFNDEGGTDEIQIQHIYNNVTNANDPNAIICYISINDGACSYLVIDMDNEYNEIQLMDRSSFAISDVIDQPSVFLIPPNSLINNNINPLVVICYVDVNRNVGKETAGCVFGELNRLSYTIKFNGGISNFEQDGADRIDALWLGGNNMIVCYVDGTEQKNRAPCLFGVISGP